MDLPVVGREERTRAGRAPVEASGHAWIQGIRFEGRKREQAAGGRPASWEDWRIRESDARRRRRRSGRQPAQVPPVAPFVPARSGRSHAARIPRPAVRAGRRSRHSRSRHRRPGSTTGSTSFRAPGRHSSTGREAPPKRTQRAGTGPRWRWRNARGEDSTRPGDARSLRLRRSDEAPAGDGTPPDPGDRRDAWRLRSSGGACSDNERLRLLDASVGESDGSSYRGTPGNP